MSNLLDVVRRLTDDELAEALQLLEQQRFPDARPEQVAPAGDWRTWYVRGGRGSGKTRTGCEEFCDWLITVDPGEWAIIGPTFGDGRDTCVEGPSGVLAVLRRRGVTPMWNRSMGELRLPNGSRVYVDGADDGALRIQGKNLRGAWCDEVGLWRRWQLAWDESLQFALRIAPAKIVATGTPKVGHGLVKRLLNDSTVAVTLLRTLDNAENLDPATVDALIKRYGGTRLGRQELDGEYLEDVVGALWTRARYDETRVDEAPDLAYLCIAVDPSGGDDEGNDEQGIVAVGRGIDGHGYTIEDRSCSLSPDGWGRRAVQLYVDLQADEIVVEANFGGDMAIAVVETAAKAMGVTVKVRKVHASRGKRQRMEPVAMLFEQGRAHHVGVMIDLEDQGCSWTPESGSSPDRLDAEAWGYTAAMLGEERRALRYRGAA